jgi:predicted enzyme related to lactoylglutathione lyase
MKRVTGLGGIFFKCKDPQKIKEWYRDNLGFKTTDWGATFVWGDSDLTNKNFCRTEWSPFKSDSNYFAPSDQPFMINYRVHDLEALLAQLKKENVQIAGEVQKFEYGKFGWILDPENRKIELWEPVDGGFGDSLAVWNDRVTGIGGVFFKSKDPEKMSAWYQEHLGVAEFIFWRDLSRPEQKAAARTVWSLFKSDTDYFAPSEKPYMFNYRVNSLEDLLKKLRAAGIDQVGKGETHPFGKFAWIMDSEGNKIELWEPKEE